MSLLDVAGSVFRDAWMYRFLRAGLALCASLVLTSPVLAAPPHLDWAQSASDVKADPAIRFGTLPNGMRYAIRKQAIPPGQAALRLWIDAGSLEERDDQQGLAHFLEHMAFNGSKAVPEGDMIKILERLGLAFGADTNASTNFDETVYKLDLPRTDDETVDTSLMLLRQSAGDLTIAQDSVDRERGVVLSEERARDTPDYRIYKTRIGFLFPGQRLPIRLPIGQVDTLKTAQATKIRDFYDHYYRPERAVLVVVGDFDPAVMEAKIRARFGDWAGVGPAGADMDLGAIKPRSPEAKVVVEPGAALSLQIVWVRPPDLAPDVMSKRRSDLVRELGFSVLNRRLLGLSRGANPPFLGAGGYQSNQGRTAELTLMSAAAEPDKWRPALIALDQEQRRIVQYGVRQDELDREIEEIRARLKASVAGAATRRPADLAGEIVESLSDREVVTSPADDLALFEETVKGLKAETVSAALQDSFKGQGPLVFLATPKAVEGGDATVLAAYQASRQQAVAASAATSQIAWPYASFGKPGVVAERKEIADLGTTMVRFRNGVRLTVKPTKFRDDQILIRVNIGRGLTALPADRQATTWAAGAFIEGGLKKIDNEDMERVLASKVYGASFAVGEDAMVLAGATRPSDLPTQMQVLAAYMTEPGWRPEAFQRLLGSGRTIHDRYEATDNGVLARDLDGLLHRGDRRFTFPSRGEIAEAKLGALEAEIAPQLAEGSVEVVIVGDVTTDAAIQSVAATFGALPPRPAPSVAPPALRKVGFPGPTAKPILITHKGRADQAIGYVAWPTTDYWENPTRALQTAVLGEVMRLRLLDELREAQGATYSPSVGYNHSMVWTGWGYLAASVEVPPAKIPGFFADVGKLAATLRTTEVSADELERAKKPRIDAMERQKVTNGYWLSELSGATADPRRLERIRQFIPVTQAVTAADVKRAAETWLQDGRAFEIDVEPQAGAAAAP
jgi:zinc protease